MAPPEPEGSETPAPEVPDEPTSAAVSAATGAESGRPAQPPYRLRDLDPRGKLWTAALGSVLLLAPILAFVDAFPDWVPSSDPAYMGIRSLDVGTSDTPLNGQPSTSGQYVEGYVNVNHLGPLHFYMMAVPIRLLGLSAGMLSVSLVIVSTCILLMAWLTYRRVGPLGGALGVAVIGLITFTTGASGLMNPVSSNMAGYPLYCSALLVWCLLRGDIRLLPLATAMVAFAAQQHLSVLPTLRSWRRPGSQGSSTTGGERGAGETARPAAS